MSEPSSSTSSMAQWCSTMEPTKAVVTVVPKEVIDQTLVAM